MRIELGYPDRDAERALLAGLGPPRSAGHAAAYLEVPTELVELQRHGATRARVHRRCSTTCRRSSRTRERSPEYVAGLSPRAALALVHAARAWALLEGRDKVIPVNVQAILPGVAAHRLRPAHDAARRVDVGAQLLAAVPIPLGAAARSARRPAPFSFRKRFAGG